MFLLGWAAHRSMKVGENGYFGILVTPRGQLSNLATRGLYICLGPKQSLLKQSHWSENSHIGVFFFGVFSNLKSHFHGNIQVALPQPASLLSH